MFFFFLMRFDLGTLDLGERLLSFGLLVLHPFARALFLPKIASTVDLGSYKRSHKADQEHEERTGKTIQSHPKSQELIQTSKHFRFYESGHILRFYCSTCKLSFNNL